MVRHKSTEDSHVVGVKLVRCAHVVHTVPVVHTFCFLCVAMGMYAGFEATCA